MVDEKCATCGGSGFIRTGETTVDRCICMRKKAARTFLGAEIAGAPRLLEGEESPLLGKEGSNLFIKGWWSHLISHIKLTLILKEGRGFYFKIVTDEKLRTVYVGAEAYGSRSRKHRDDMETFNSLADIIGADYDLVIVRLGFLGHKNIAMPGVLKETLMLREVANKATWIIEEPCSIFGPGHHSFNEEVADYIERYFTVVDVTKKVDTPVVPRGVSTLERDSSEDGEITLGASEEGPETISSTKSFMPTSRFNAPEREGLDFGVLGGDTPRWKKSGGGKPWKKKGGGGPI